MGQESGGIPVQKPKVKLDVTEEDLSKMSEEQLRDIAVALLKEPPVKKERKQTKAEQEEASRREFRRLQALAKMTPEERAASLEEDEAIVSSTRVRAYLSRLRFALDDLDRRCMLETGRPNILLVLFDGFCEVSAATFLLAARAGCRVVRLAVDMSDGVDVGAREGALAMRGEGGVTLEADVRFAAASNCGLASFDALVLPSGRVGSLTRLRENAKFASLLRTMIVGQRVVASVGLAPAVVLAPMGLFDGGRRWCGALADAAAKPAGEGVYVGSGGVVRDGVLMTAAGASDALALVRAVVSGLTDEGTAARLLDAIV